MRAKLGLLAMTGLLCLLTADAAGASISTGFGSGLLSTATQRTGTGLFANTVHGTSSYTTRICRIPRGATACTAAGAVTFSSDTGSDAAAGTQVFAGPGNTVYLASIQAGASAAEGNHTYVATSPDGGQTFSAPQLLGSEFSSGATDEAVAQALDSHVSGGGVATVSEVTSVSPASFDGVYFQLVPLSGTAVTQHVALFGLSNGDMCCTALSVGVLPTGQVAAALSYGGGVELKISNRGATNLNDPTSWPSSPTMISGRSLPVLLTSPSHLDLITENGAGSGFAYERRLDGGTLGAESVIPMSGFPVYPAFAADPAGRLFATWKGSEGLESTHSDSSGSNWSPRVLLACSTPTLSYDYALSANGIDDGFASFFDGRSAFQALPLSSRPSCGGGPTISHLSQSNRSWLEHLDRHHRHTPVGTTFSFRLNIAAQVTLSFQKIESGQLVGRRCVAPSRRRHPAHACRRLVSVGSIAASERAGTARIPFTGRIGRHSLPAGSYVLSVSAVAGGRRSAVHQLRFTVVS